MDIRHLAAHEPRPDSPCLCGSRESFKNCCRNHYSENARNKAHAEYEAQRYTEALRATRHFLTWYILSHKAHTVPFLNKNRGAAARLLYTDIEALACIVDQLERCYHHCGIIEQFPFVLNQLGDAIDDPRWKNKVACFRSLWWLLQKNDRAMAFKELSGINIAECKDAEILTVYLDVHPDKLPFNELENLINRILENTIDPGYTLQYSLLKGMGYVLINEILNGSEIIREAILGYRGISQERRTEYGDLYLAHSLHALGGVTSDRELVRESTELYVRLGTDAVMHGHPPSHVAFLYKCLGDSERDQGNHGQAIQHYKVSLQYEHTDVTQLFLASAYTNMQDLVFARDLLQKINTEQLGKEAHYDCAMAWALLATSSLDAGDREFALTLLRSVRCDWPLLESQRDKVIIKLLELNPSTPKSKIRSLLLFLNNYLSLNPNMFGIGIDINRIVKDVFKDRAP